MTNDDKGAPARREVLGAIGAGAGLAAMAASALPAAAQSAGGKASTSPSDLRIVDFHNHFVSPSQKLNAAAANPLLNDTAALLSSVDAAGLQARVINTPTAFIEDADGNVPKGTHQRINDEVAALVAKNPGRLHGLATVDAYAGDDAAKELERAVRELKLRGVFLEAGKRDLLLDAPQARPTLRMAAQLGVPVFVHPVTDPAMHNRFKKHGRLGVRLARGTINSASLVAMLEGGVLDESPSLRVVVTTLALGGVMLAGGFGDGSRIRSDAPQMTRRHVYIDTMGLHPVEVRCAIDLLGADHVLMGTDWPIAVEKDVPARLHTALAAAGLDAQQMQMVAGGNTMRLLGLA